SCSGVKVSSVREEILTVLRLSCDFHRSEAIDVGAIAKLPAAIGAPAVRQPVRRNSTRMPFAGGQRREPEAASDWRGGRAGNPGAVAELVAPAVAGSVESHSARVVTSGADRRPAGDARHLHRGRAAGARPASCEWIVDAAFRTCVRPGTELPVIVRPPAGRAAIGSEAASVPVAHAQRHEAVPGRHSHRHIPGDRRAIAELPVGVVAPAVRGTVRGQGARVLTAIADRPAHSEIGERQTRYRDGDGAPLRWCLADPEQPATVVAPTVDRTSRGQCARVFAPEANGRKGVSAQDGQRRLTAGVEALLRKGTYPQRAGAPAVCGAPW